MANLEIGNYDESHFVMKIIVIKKSRIRDTKHLSTDADSSTDTTVGWTIPNNGVSFRFYYEQDILTPSD